MDYIAALRLLDSVPDYERQPRGHRFSLDRFRRFLTALGSPQDKLRNVILVAGTKGKGSTCAMLDRALRSAGFRTGLYTSPHLVDVRERIRVSGKMIPKPGFARLVSRIKPVLAAHPVTWFEAMTALAMLYFIEQHVDFTILEVGLGGRLDATNVANPLLSVVTRIGFDHTEVLGRALPGIAHEKAGIVRPCGTVIVAAQALPALRALREAARRRRARLVYVPGVLGAGNVLVEPESTSFETCSPSVPMPRRGHWVLGLTGRHQVENALTVIAVARELRQLGYHVKWRDIDQGFQLTSLPARCSIIRRSPLLAIDAAHNPESIAALATYLTDIRQRNVTFVIGLLRDKPAAKILRLLKPLARKLVIVAPPSPRAMKVTELATAARKVGIEYQVATRLKPEMLHRNEPVVIAGSFYLAGEAIRLAARYGLCRSTS